MVGTKSRPSEKLKPIAALPIYIDLEALLLRAYETNYSFFSLDVCPW
jgi:hypothetical protein